MTGNAKNTSPAITSVSVMKRKTVIVGMLFIIAFLHIVGIGSWLSGYWRNIYSSYFSDVALPFSFYFLLCANQFRLPLLRHWIAKAAIVFALASAAETFQYFGVYALGVTFDPVDYLMYGVGVMLAAVVDTQVFSRIFKFWMIQPQEVMQ